MSSSTLSTELSEILSRVAAGGVAFASLTIAERRKRMEMFNPPICAAGVTATACGEVPGALLLTPGDALSDGPIIFYVHGGGFITGSPEIALGAASGVAARTGMRVLVPRYRLAPEHPYPAQLDDLERAWKECVGGLAPSALSVFGESAGGNLAQSLMHRLGSAGRQAVAVIVLLSPALDLTLSGSSMTSNETHDILFTRDSFLEMRTMYAPGADYVDPELSPLFGELSDFPPVRLMCSSTEMLRDDSLRLVAQIGAADGSVELVMRPGMPHCWPVFAGSQFPEAQVGLDRVAQWLCDPHGVRAPHLTEHVG